ncbi:TIGR00303 family protein, partial [Synechococcus sp. OH2]
AAAQRGPVLLAGGTQMLAVLALMRRWGEEQGIPWPPENVVVGTTRWVAEDPSGNTVAL